jgi:hypothetical protein
MHRTGKEMSMLSWAQMDIWHQRHITASEVRNRTSSRSVHVWLKCAMTVMVRFFFYGFVWMVIRRVTRTVLTDGSEFSCMPGYPTLDKLLKRMTSSSPEKRPSAMEALAVMQGSCVGSERPSGAGVSPGRGKRAQSLCEYVEENKWSRLKEQEVF